MQIHPIDVDTPAELLARLHEADVAAHAEIPGPPSTLRGLSWRFTRADAGERPEGYAWVEDGEVVAAYAQSFQQRDNPHMTWLYPFFVRPRRRRQGLGSAMLEHAKDRARADGRRMLLTESLVDGPAADFAKARGWTVWENEARRTLDLREADWEALRALAPPYVENYVVELSQGPAGPAQLADLALLMVGMNDAPHGEDINPSTFDAELMREREESIIPRGSYCYTAIARRVSDGAPAGYTRLYVDSDRSSGWAHQADTTVLKEHRGHRLGQALKVANLLQLKEREPEITRVITWNSTSNAHMLAINEAMGFRLFDVWNTWQLHL